jgi:hypothetical protein
MNGNSERIPRRFCRAGEVRTVRAGVNKNRRSFAKNEKLYYFKTDGIKEPPSLRSTAARQNLRGMRSLFRFKMISGPFTNSSTFNDEEY